MGSADFSQFVVTTANETACEISTLKVHALFPHLPATFTGTSSNFWTSSLLADLSVFPSLICGSCTSGQGFAYSLLTASFRFHLTMDTLAVQLCTSSLPTRTRDFHPLERAHGAQTKKQDTVLPCPVETLYFSTTQSKAFIRPGKFIHNPLNYPYYKQVEL